MILKKRDRIIAAAKKWKQYMEIGAKACNLHGYAKELGACNCGEVKLSGEPLGDLKGEVHHIFAADNWPLENFESKEGKKAWKRMEPALQLATRFLLSKAGLAFFRHVRFGEGGAHAEDQGCDRNYLAYDEPSSERNRTKEEQIVIKDLEKLAKRIKCVFSVFFLPDKPDHQIHPMGPLPKVCPAKRSLSVEITRNSQKRKRTLTS
jgi:hypothetical protein